jgi:hypothetical protein
VASRGPRDALLGWLACAKVDPQLLVIEMSAFVDELEVGVSEMRAPEPWKSIGILEGVYVHKRRYGRLTWTA